MPFPKTRKEALADLAFHRFHGSLHPLIVAISDLPCEGKLLPISVLIYLSDEAFPRMLNIRLV